MHANESSRLCVARGQPIFMNENTASTRAWTTTTTSSISSAAITPTKACTCARVRSQRKTSQPVGQRVL